MPQKREKIVRRLRYKTHFYIVVIEREGSYFGRWHCHHCGAAGAESTGHGTIDEAVVTAKSGTAGHVHRR